MIIWYNTLFQMTFFVTKETQKDNSMLMFKIHSQVYHRIGSLLFKTEDNIKLLLFFKFHSNQVHCNSVFYKTLKIIK